MVDLVARELGRTLLVLWTTDDGLGRKVTATRGESGARYGREISPGQWRYEQIAGSSATVFTQVRQLSVLVRMLYARDGR